MQGFKDLTNGSIRKQLLNLALPIMGTSFIQMAYSLTDMAWVGRLGSEAVAAIGAVGILTWLTSSISLLNKVGAEVSVGQSIGAQNLKDARLFSSHNITLATIISLIWGIFLFIFANPVIELYQLDSEISNNAVNYLRIISTAFPFVFLIAAFTGIYNAAGMSKIPFYTCAVGLLLNMILDPLFILVFGWGTIGAAWATWISEGFVCILFIYQLKSRHPLFEGFPFFAKLKTNYTLKIFKLGLPVAILNSLFAVINLFMGRIASAKGGHIGLMTMTTGGQIEAIAWNTSQAFSTALSTFVAQNFAAGRKDRIRGAYHNTLLISSGLGIFITILFFFFGGEVFSLIVPGEEAYLSGRSFLRIDSYSMILMMIEITMQGLFYGLGRTVPPAIISITFNIIRIPLSIFLASTSLGIEGVWWAISITSMLKGIVAFLWFRSIQKKVF